MSIVSLLVSLRGMAIAGGLAAVIAFGAGWKVRDAFCDANAAQAALTAANARIVALQDNIARMARALNKDREAAERDTARLMELERTHRELLDQISAGKCLTADDVNRVRDIFGSGRTAH